jgi:hypothetical protein
MKKHNKITSPLNKNSNRDIEGSWSKPLKRNRLKGIISNMDYSDLNKISNVPKRVTDPLQPVYKMKYGDGYNYPLT